MANAKSETFPPLTLTQETFCSIYRVNTNFLNGHPIWPQLAPCLRVEEGPYSIRLPTEALIIDMSLSDSLQPVHILLPEL